MASYIPLKKYYNEHVVPTFIKQHGYHNKLAVPRIDKVVLNVGLNQGRQKEPKYIPTVEETLKRISSQNPVKTIARKSISSFKVREDTVIGMMVTLRGARMYDFLDRLIHVALPRTRDFWGVDQKSVDGSGNMSLGFSEHLVFPEIRSDEVECIHGLEVTIVTTAHDRKEGMLLLETLGIPFKKDT